MVYSFVGSSSRGGKSKVILPLSSMTRWAGKGRPALEMKFVSRSVRLVSSNFTAWAGSIGCCRITLLILNLHGRLSAWDFSHKYAASVSKTLPPHLGHLPIDCLPVKSILGTGFFG